MIYLDRGISQGIPPGKDGIITMDENTQARFDEKVNELLAVAKKKKNVLEYQEISEFFADMPLEEEQFEKILEVLDQNKVDVLRITEDDHLETCLLYTSQRPRDKRK